MTKTVRLYRIVVVALAAFYFLDRFFAETYVWDNFGWQFRYLTIWGLTGSFIVAAMMLTPAYGARDGRGDVVVAVVGVINMLIVFSYWRLFFTDPSLVNGEKTPVVYREYYLHLIGPILQWIDMLWIKRAFRRPMRVAGWLGTLVIVYVAWSELIVKPLNDDPVGTVSSGLPYPFLNDMLLPERAMFYATIYITGLVFVGLFWAVQRAISKRQIAPL